MSLKSSRIDSLRGFQTHRSTANLVEVEVALESLSTIVDVSLGAVSSDQTTICSEGGSSTTVEFLSPTGDVPLLQVSLLDVDSASVQEHVKGTKEDEVCSGQGALRPNNWFLYLLLWLWFQRRARAEGHS